MAESRNKLLSTLTMPVGTNIKAKLDDYLNEYLNVPLAESGHPDAGAAISAALSSAGEFLIPDNLADAALAAVPGARLVKAGKGMKKLIPGLEKAGVINYKNIAESEKAVAGMGRDAAEKAANTLQYKLGGKEIVNKPPKDLWDYELRQAEKEAAEASQKVSK